MLPRRQLLQVGCSSVLGLTLLTKSAVGLRHKPQAKSVILVFLTSSGSHIDTFDPKPEAVDVRGEFKAIGTRIPGIQFTEHVPRLADRADRLAIVRSMAHDDNRHLSGTHNTLTGSPQPFWGNANEDKFLNRGNWPAYGLTVAMLRQQRDGIPTHVTIPQPLI